MPCDVWTSPRLSAYLEAQTGIRIAPGWLRVLLHRQRFVCSWPKHTLKHLQDPAEVAAGATAIQAAGKKVAAAPDRDELPFEDETHLDTSPYLSRVWHRVGQQPTLPAVGTNRRLTVFWSLESGGVGPGTQRGAVGPAGSAGFARYLAALDARHEATGQQIILVLDNGPCHVRKSSHAALVARSAWLEVIPLARDRPQLNPKERE